LNHILDAPLRGVCFGMSIFGAEAEKNSTFFPQNKKI